MGHVARNCSGNPACEKCLEVRHETRYCRAKGSRETCSEGALCNRVAQSLGCVKEEQVDAKGSDEIKCEVSKESMGTMRDNEELGHYKVYIVSPQLKEGLGVALLETDQWCHYLKNLQ
jgi:hypothetical protein